MPSPVRTNDSLNEEVARELSYNVDPDSVSSNEAKLLPEQTMAFETIYESIQHSKGGLFFLDAPGGTGKTFLLNLLLSKVRLHIGVALATASSGIAATLLVGGKTAHSTFKLPLKHEKTPMCNITKQSARGQLLKQTRLIVWDECAMAHKNNLEALDRSLQDLNNTSTLMGGITVVLAGDFRQILPVIVRGTKADEINACLKKSYIWQSVRRLSLTKNMRAHITGDNSAEEFSKQLLQIGNGQTLMCGEYHMLPCGQLLNHSHELLEKVFPDLKSNHTSPTWLCERAILAPRNDTVDTVNRILLEEIPGDKQVFQSNDSVADESEAVKFPIEFLNGLKPSGMPPHNLFLKKGAPVMLLRNLNPPRLCNGTRLVVRSLSKYLVEATIIGGVYDGEIVAIPRIPLQSVDSNMPFTFRRLQFPLRLSFAMSINKSQGQSLKVVGLQLELPCFTHGQLYVGCSRVGSESNLFVYTPNEGRTENIVYTEILEPEEHIQNTAPVLSQSEEPMDLSNAQTKNKERTVSFHNVDESISLIRPMDTTSIASNDMRQSMNTSVTYVEDSGDDGPPAIPDKRVVTNRGSKRAKKPTKGRVSLREKTQPISKMMSPNPRSRSVELDINYVEDSDEEYLNQGFLETGDIHNQPLFEGSMDLSSNLPTNIQGDTNLNKRCQVLGKGIQSTIPANISPIHKRRSMESGVTYVDDSGEEGPPFVVQNMNRKRKKRAPVKEITVRRFHLAKRYLLFMMIALSLPLKIHS